MNRFLARGVPRVTAAIAIGLSVSLLFSRIIPTQTGLAWNVLFWLQSPGFFAGMFMHPHVSSYVMVGLNAILYTLIAFGFLSAFGGEEELN
jgi:hypothetical protein